MRCLRGRCSRSCADRGRTTRKLPWVRIPPPPPLTELREAPLVDGKWLDRHAHALAEAGAILPKRGFTFEIADDNHPLAWDPAVDDHGTEAARETVVEALPAAR